MNWGRVYLEDHSLSMIDFIEGLFFKLGERFSSFFLSNFLDVVVYFVCTFFAASRHC